MVNQKMISFKVDSGQLELLDSVLPLIGCNRNKFLNMALSTVLACVSIQVDVCNRKHISPKKIPFLM